MGPVALALVLAGGPAEPIAVELSWTAPAACPDEASIAGDLAELTRGALVHGPSTARRVDVVVTARGDGFALALDVATPELTEHRTLEGASCETLARAATLMISVAIAPIASAEELEAVVPPLPTGPGSTAPTAATELPSIDSPPARAPSRRATRDRGFVGVWTGPSFGTQPQVTAILGADVGWRRGAFGLQLSGWHAFAAQRSLAPGIGVRASTSGGGARMVYAPPVRAVELPLSLGVELGALIGEGTGALVQGKTTTSLWAAAVLGIGLAWPARSRIALALRTDALVTLRARGIHLDRGAVREIAFVAPPVGLRVLAGPLVRFP